MSTHRAFAPAVLAALLAGSALAVSGAIMQAVRNNPLASPGLLGINAGAAFATQPSTENYPICSKTVTDNCVQSYERGTRSPS